MRLISAFKYAVVLRPFETLEFTTDATTVLSEPVQIVTMRAKGPRPVAYTPPAYSPLTPCNEDDMYVPSYNNGILMR
jgi:hypothetical protein